MADSFIQLTTDGAGKQLDTALVNMGVGTTAVHREKMVVADPLSTSGFATVTSSAGLLVQATGPLSISGTVAIVSASSGLVQISGIPIVAITSSAIAPINIVTSSGAIVPTTTSLGILVSQSTGALVPANLVTTSGGPLVATTSAGLLVQATGPITIAGTVTVVNTSSGLVQIAGVATVGVTTSGFDPVLVVTSSGAYVPTSTSLGLLVSQSTAALVPTLIVTSSGGSIVATTSFGLRISQSTDVLVPTNIVTSSGGNLVATTSQGLQVQQSTSKIVPVLAASSGLISIDLWQATSRISPTFISATTISKMSSAPGNLFLVTGFTTSTGGIGATTPALIRFYNASTSNVTMNTGVQMILPIGMQSSSTSLTGQGDVANPLSIAPFMPIGVGFSAACSFDIVQTATSTAAVAGTGYITGIYSTN